MIFILPLIIAVSLMIYYHLNTKAKQREMLIEHGINPDGLSIIEYQKIANLTNGILFVSISIGFLIGYVVKATLTPEDFLIVYLISITFSCGIGFFVNYFIYKNVKMKQ